MRRILLLTCLLLAACDQSSSPVSVKKDVSMDPLTDINARLAFTCKYETIPEASADANILFKYARWLQVNNQLKEDETVGAEVERLYRIAAANDHYKASINLQNGAMRGQFSLTSDERLRMSQQLIDAKVATGYYFIAIYLQNGAAGLKEDPEMALRYYRKAADEGNPQAQAYVGDKLAKSGMAADIAREMRRCAAEQGEGEAAGMLAINLKGKGRYQDALEAFQLGVAAGDETSAGTLGEVFLGPAPSDPLYYIGQQKDLERSRRYEAIWRILANYSYANPTVPEINDIVPLPPAELPAWDGKLKWLEARKANIPPTKPGEALIERLAKDKQLNPATGRPLPTSPDFANNEIGELLCQTGEPCPKTGYWQVTWIPHIGSSTREIISFTQGDIMPTDNVTFYRQRIWPFSDMQHQEEQHVHWRFMGEV